MSLQERIEASAWGRRAIGAFLALLLTLMVVDNLPSSHIQRKAGKVAEPVLNALGPRQHWDLYSPDPYPTSTEVEVRMVREDGAVDRWQPPEGGPFLSPYRSYRWQKVVERVDERSIAIGLLTWVITHEQDPARPIRTAQLIRRERAIARPGRPASERGPWRESVLYEVHAGGG